MKRDTIPYLSFSQCNITDKINRPLFPPPSSTSINYPRYTIAPAANSTKANGLARFIASLLELVVAAALEPAMVEAASVLVVLAVVEAVLLLVKVAELRVVFLCSTVPVAADKLPPAPVPIAPVPAAVVVTTVALEMEERDATREETELFRAATEEDNVAAEVADADELEVKLVVGTAALPPERVNSPL